VRVFADSFEDEVRLALDTELHSGLLDEIAVASWIIGVYQRREDAA
jgi:hypothetical protein